MYSLVYMDIFHASKIARYGVENSLFESCYRYVELVKVSVKCLSYLQRVIW